MRAWWLVLAVACGGGSDDVDGETDSEETDDSPALVAPDGPVPGSAQGESATSEAGFLVQWVTTPFPAEVGQATLEITVTDAAGVPVEGNVQIEPWMSIHGHGPAGDTDVSNLGDGAWRGTWDYSMPGPWEVTITVRGEELVLTYEVEGEM